MNQAADTPAEADSTSPEGAAKKNSERVSTWLKELQAALRREKKWRAEALDIVEIYEGGKLDATPFNILYSNTETLSPALYNTVPRPVVRQRYKSDDELGKAAARVAQRILSYQLNSDDSDEPSFNCLMETSVLSALLPGRAVTKFRYDAEIEGPPEQEDLAEGSPPPAPIVKEEEICGESIPWDHFVHGYGQSWDRVPWCAYLHNMTREELVSNFGADIGNKVSVTEASESNSEDAPKSSQAADKRSDGTKFAPVWEIWDKTTEKVIFITEHYKDMPLKEVDDPLELEGFFPSPEPLYLFKSLRGLLPVPLYRLYKKQAEELNTVTKRITVLVKALRVRGFYDSSIPEIAKVLQADDNTLVAAENMAGLFSLNGKATDAVWLMPLNELVNALQQLYTQREQIKTLIYELTGIADIMRGSSAASETLGAQQIKNQWGTLRLKRMQKSVIQYCVASLRIMLELAVTKISVETLRKMTGMQFPTNQERQQAQMQAQQMAMQAQPGQQPPELQPELAQKLNAPTWEEIMAVLQDDLQRNFRIDIETNSTLDAEATEDKQDVTDMLGALSQFLNGAGPLIQDGTLPFEAAKKILITIMRRFRFGDDVEDELQKMQAPEPPPDPNEGKAAADQQRMQMEMQKMQADTKNKQDLAATQLQIAQADLELKKELAGIAQQQAQMEMAFATQEHQLKMEELQQRSELGRQKHQQALAEAMLPKPAPMPARPGKGA